MDYEFTDRYEALGVELPNPATICKGQCEGLGFYPQRADDPEATEEELRRWQVAHVQFDAHRNGPCDGYHFIKCPDCEGTGKRK